MNTEEELISRYLDQQLNEEEVSKLEESLRRNPDLRRKFYGQGNVINALEEKFSVKLPDEKIITLESNKSNHTLTALVACLLVGFGLFI